MRVLEAGKRPEILEAGTSAVVELGQDVQFTCNANGTPRPFVLWYKDNDILDQRHPRSLPSFAFYFVVIC